MNWLTGNLGFSYVGFLFLLLLFIPNIIWSRHKPTGYDSKDEPKLLSACERIGQVSVTCLALIFTDFNLQQWSWWSLWLLAAFILMLFYEFWWLRYFKSAKTLKDFYSSLWGIPVAGATLPVLAFLLLSIYGRVLWLLLAVIILGVGHIGVHLHQRRKLNSQGQA